MAERNDSLSHSRRDTFQRCHRLYYYRYKLNLIPKDEPAPLRMGSAYSMALEENDPDAAARFYHDAVLHCMQHGPYHLVDLMLDEAAVVVPMAETYLEHVALPDIVREHKFLGRIFEGLEDNGYMDGIRFPAHEDEPYLLVENKLKGRFLRADEQALDFDDQLTGYVANACREFDVHPSRVEIRYEVALKPQLRQTQKETREGFRLRVSNAIRTDPSKYHKVYKPRVRTEDDLVEYHEFFDALARQVRAEEEADVWIKTRHACSMFGGCAFIPLCSRGERSLREAMQGFKVKQPRGRDEQATQGDVPVP